MEIIKIQTILADLNTYQLEVLERVSEEITNKYKDEGLMSVELFTIGCYLMSKNIESANNFVELSGSTAKLLKDIDKFLKDLENKAT